MLYEVITRLTGEISASNILGQKGFQLPTQQVSIHVNPFYLTQFFEPLFGVITSYSIHYTKLYDLKKPGEFSEDPLTELLRHGARQLIAEAVEAELQA